VLAVRASLAPVVDQDAGREREADRAASALRGVVAAEAAPAAGAGGLDRRTQAFFGERLRHDFSRVRVHADEKAAGVARMLGASAFTVGHDIYFGRGAYQPHRPEGSRLLAHELVHVVQQSRLAQPRVQRRLVAAGDTAGFAAAANAVIGVQFEVVVSNTGEVSLRSTRVAGPLTPEAQELVRVIRLVSGDAQITRMEFIHGQTSTRPNAAMVLGGSYALSTVDLDDVAALGTQGSVGLGMGRTGGSLLAHEILEQYRKQVHGEGFGLAHAQATAAEEGAVGATRGPERYTNMINVNNFTVTIPYTYSDGHVVEVTWDVVNGNYRNVRRRLVTPARSPARTP
jgi:hypothetical protein